MIGEIALSAPAARFLDEGRRATIERVQSWEDFGSPLEENDFPDPPDNGEAWNQLPEHFRDVVADRFERAADRELYLFQVRAARTTHVAIARKQERAEALAAREERQKERQARRTQRQTQRKGRRGGRHAEQRP